jgi:hypothetical protein
VAALARAGTHPRGRETATLRARARATIIAVEPHPYIRVGSLATVTLTVRTSAGEFSRRLYLSPLTHHVTPCLLIAWVARDKLLDIQLSWCP